MSRHEYEDIEHLNLPDKDMLEIVYVFDDGNTLPKEYSQNVTQKICAKQVKHNKTDISSYYILSNDHNRMFDPRQRSRVYRKYIWKYKKVDKECFDLYIKFLKQKYTSLLSQAER